MQSSSSSDSLGPEVGAGALLIKVPQAELRQVAENQTTPPQLVAEGPFSIYTVEVAGETKIRAQVGSVSWDVLPTSQTLKAGEQTYIFTTAIKGVFYALTLGAATEPEALGIVEAVLENVTLLKESERLMQDPAAQEGEAALAKGVTYKFALARGVHKASSSIASGLMVGATYVSGSFDKAASYLRTGEATNQPMQLSDGFKRRIDQTTYAAQLLSKAANSVVGGLAWIGGKVAGGVLWAIGADKPLEPGQENGPMGLMREMSHATVSGFTEVWDSMENAGHLVLTTARDSTAKVVEHRYGAEAGAATAQSMTAAGYATDAVWSTRRIGVRTVAKAAAKKTAKGVIKKWAGQDERHGGGSASGGSVGGSRGGSGQSTPAAAVGRSGSPAPAAPKMPAAGGAGNIRAEL